MQKARAKYLIEALIRNRLSRQELDELLEGMNKDEMLDAYSDTLKDYFNSLLADNGNDTPAS